MNLFAAYYQIDLLELLIYLGLGAIVVVALIAAWWAIFAIPWFLRRARNDVDE